MRSALGFIFVAITLGPLACGSTEPASPPSDAGTGARHPFDASDDVETAEGGVALDAGEPDAQPRDAEPLDGADEDVAVSCTPLDLASIPTIAVTAGTGMLPAFVGGTVTPGHYVLTSIAYYSDDGVTPFDEVGAQARGVVDLGAASFAFAYARDSTWNVLGTYATSGNQISVTSRCPPDSGKSGAGGYSATPTTIALVVETHNSLSITPDAAPAKRTFSGLGTFTRQP